MVEIAVDILIDCYFAVKRDLKHLETRLTKSLLGVPVDEIKRSIVADKKILDFLEIELKDTAFMKQRVGGRKTNGK